MNSHPRVNGRIAISTVVGALAAMSGCAFLGSRVMYLLAAVLLTAAISLLSYAWMTWRQDEMTREVRRGLDLGISSLILSVFTFAFSLLVSAA